MPVYPQKSPKPPQFPWRVSRSISRKGTCGRGHLSQRYLKGKRTKTPLNRHKVRSYPSFPLASNYWKHRKVAVSKATSWESISFCDNTDSRFLIHPLEEILGEIQFVRHIAYPRFLIHPSEEILGEIQFVRHITCSRFLIHPPKEKTLASIKKLCAW